MQATAFSYKTLWTGILLATAGFLLWFFNPADTALFPRCPFFSLTGFLCPGCGSQRALHQLLHLQVRAAWNYNPLLIVALPYILTGFIFERLPARPAILTWRRRLFGFAAILLVLAITLAFWILRNVL